MAGSIDREKILDAARVCFARLGYRRASLAAIVRPLGVAKTAIYHHFPCGKEEIFHALIDREEAAVLREMAQAVNAVPDPPGQLRALFMAKLTHFHKLRALLRVPRDVGEEVAALYEGRETTFREKERVMITAILRRGQDEGVFRPGDPVALAKIIQTVFNRLELPLVFHDSPEAMNQEVEALFDLLFYGIRKEQKKDD